MSRFAALDLEALPDPSSIIELDFGAILEARLQELEAQLGEVFAAPKVAEIMALARNIASSPMRYLNEAAAARELYLSNQINMAIKSIYLSTAQGGDLDLHGANRGLVRKILDDSDRDSPILEGDVAFRARIQLVAESWSPHGTEGSYVYWALDADDRIVDVAVYGPNSPVVPAVLPSQPVMVVLSSQGDGTADAGLLEVVYQNCTTDRRRPVADKLTVISAEIVPYAIEAVLHVTSPEAVASVEAAAQAAAQAFVNSRIRIGRKLYASSIAAALNVQGVVDVELLSPSANLDIGDYSAPYCTAITLSTAAITGGWRDV